MMKLSEEIKKYLNDVEIDTDDNYETIKHEWLPKIKQLEKELAQYKIMHDKLDSLLDTLESLDNEK